MDGALMAMIRRLHLSVRGEGKRPVLYERKAMYYCPYHENINPVRRLISGCACVVLMSFRASKLHASVCRQAYLCKGYIELNAGMK